MLWSGFILGLLGSFHCVGMCGPIAFLLPVDRSHSVKKITQTSIYHVGRLISYGLLGALFGFIGKGFYLFGLQQQLSIFIGILMIVLVLIPIKTLNKHRLTFPIFKVITTIKSSLGQALKRKTNDTFLTIGFLNGFLPCGLVYMAVFASLTMQSIVESSIYMILFGLGTIPLMTTAIYLGKFLNNIAKQRIQKAIPIFVIVIGLLFVFRGLGLGIPYLSPAPITEIAEGAINCH